MNDSINAMFLLVMKLKVIGMLFNAVHGQVQKSIKNTYNKEICQVSQPLHFVNYELCCQKQVYINLNSYPTLLQDQFKLC